MSDLIPSIKTRVQMTCQWIWYNMNQYYTCQLENKNQSLSWAQTGQLNTVKKQVPSLGECVPMIAPGSGLTGMESNVVFYCISPSTSELKFLFILNVFSAHHSCTESLFKLLYTTWELKLMWPFSFEFSYQHAFPHAGLSLTQCFLFLKNSTQPIWYQQPYHDQSHRNHTLSFISVMDLNINWNDCPVSAWFLAFCCYQMIGWLDNCMQVQMCAKVFLIKCIVSAYIQNMYKQLLRITCSNLSDICI